jgi:hypothetical protein
MDHAGLCSDSMVMFAVTGGSLINRSCLEMFTSRDSIRISTSGNMSLEPSEVCCKLTPPPVRFFDLQNILVFRVSNRSCLLNYVLPLPGATRSKLTHTVLVNSTRSTFPGRRSFDNAEVQTALSTQGWPSHTPISIPDCGH